MHAYPNYDQLPLSIATEHASNIFGVQFLPHSGDQILVSGAMDSMVQLHRLDAPPETKFCYPSTLEASRGQGSTTGASNCVNVQPGTVVFNCHHGRVKDVEVDDENPNLFWSVSEDGSVRHFADQMQSGAMNTIVGVRSQNGEDCIELKGIDINKARPHMLGVACGDPYVRVFDRRRLSLGKAENTFPEPLLKLSPPHLPIRFVDEERCHSTYVNFSNRGDRLVSLFHADHAYTFDITSEGTAARTFVQPQGPPISPLKNGHVQNGHSSTGSSHGRIETPALPVLSAEATRMRDEAMYHLAGHEYTKANQYLDLAIRKSPSIALLYVQRARSLMKRNLPGDSVFALGDCDQAIELDPGCSDALLIRCQAVESIGQPQTAQRLLRSYLKKFPIKKRSEQVTELCKRIAMQLDKSKKSIQPKRQREVYSFPSSRFSTCPVQHPEEEKDDFHDVEMEDCSETHRAEASSSSGDVGPSHLHSSDTLEEDADCDEYLYPFYCREKEETEKGCPGGVWWGTQGGRRLLTRYVGQLNVQTDIKECVFLGHNDALIACGSDGGNVVIYNSETGHAVNVLKADEDVSNCVQCHPTEACLATSGIESVVRLWTPTGERVTEDSIDERIGTNLETMKRGPRRYHINNDQMLMRVRMILDNYELGEVFGGAEGREGSDEEEEGGRRTDCRMV